MKKLFTIALLLMVVAFAHGQGMIRSIGTWQYGQYVKYDPVTPGNYPVILFLPGSGQRGTNVDVVDQEGIPRLLKAGLQVPYIVICPQIPTTITGWYKAQFIGLKKILDQYPERHITGLSLGGSGVFNFVSYDSSYFASAGAVCGKPSGDFNLYRTIPLKVWHGTDDTKVVAGPALMLVAKLEASLAPVHHHYYYGLGHGIWNDVYEPGNVYGYWAWLGSIK